MNENTYTRSVDSETHCPSFLISVRPNQNCFLCRLNPLRLISSEISLFSLLDSISTSLAFWLLQNLFASYQFIGLSLNLWSSIGVGHLAKVSIVNLHVAACRKSHPRGVTCTSYNEQSFDSSMTWKILQLLTCFCGCIDVDVNNLSVVGHIGIDSIRTFLHNKKFQF